MRIHLLLLLMLSAQLSLLADGLPEAKREGFGSLREELKRSGNAGHTEYNLAIKSGLASLWELTPETKRGTFKVRTYNPIYVLPFRFMDRPNRLPVNVNPDRPEMEYQPYQKVEAKFQVSLKVKVAQGLFNGKGDLWIGYTQDAYWQVYNGTLSRPFRELNYQPEVMFVMPLNLRLGGLTLRALSLSLNHQSNGQSQMRSRSWDRLIIRTGWEWERLFIFARYFIRWRDDVEKDDNPDLHRYIGPFELQVGLPFSGYHGLGLKLQNNLRFNKGNKGSAELTYLFPIKQNLLGMVQASHGYGASLIDYNHRQTVISAGFTLRGF